MTRVVSLAAGRHDPVSQFHRNEGMSSTSRPFASAGPAWLLASAGVLPFLGAIVDVVAFDGKWLSSIQIYGALIASFISGIHWGAAILSSEGTAVRLLFLSNVAALLAWLAALLPPSSGFLLLAVLFAAFLIVDRQLRRRGLWPEWFWTLRVVISAVVICACVVLGVLA